MEKISRKKYNIVRIGDSVMEISVNKMEFFEPINETSYLSVPNAPTYRKIMRCFYREYEKMHFQLYKEDIFMLLKQDEKFADYTMEQLLADLEALVKWKNLTPIQDPGRVYTIADYKNKQYRYTMSEYAVEIERLTVRLENIFVESTNTDFTFFSSSKFLENSLFKNKSNHIVTTDKILKMLIKLLKIQNSSILINLSIIG